MTHWVQYDDQDLGVRVRIPDPTPMGRSIRFEEKRHPDCYRVHLTSHESQEVYFEIGRYVGVTQDDAVRRFTNGLPEDLGTPQLTGPEAAIVSGHPAARLKVRWPDRVRWVYFLHLGGDTFRVILDPTSGLNVQMLASLDFAVTGR